MAVMWGFSGIDLGGDGCVTQFERAGEKVWLCVQTSAKFSDLGWATPKKASRSSQ